MNKHICILSICVLALCFKGQAQNIFEKELENGVNYLLNNKQKLASVWLSLIKENSATFFDYKKIIGQELDFEISDTLTPRGLLPFVDSLRKDKILLNLSDEEIDNLIIVDQNTRFKPYINQHLKSLLQTSGLKEDKDFKIVFSEPIRNTLAGELWYTYLGRGLRTRFGDSIMILFVFDDKGCIKKVYFSRAIK
jgi:hypothetical protein